MNTLVAALDNGGLGYARTANGARTLPTSGSKNVDLFSSIASAKDLHQVVHSFAQAYAEDKRIATAVALWSRDVRGGAGRRAAFRQILQYLEVNDFEVFTRVIARVPELGRWDDVLCVKTDAGRTIAFGMIAQALANGDRLCAKWMPRKSTPGNITAAQLRQFLDLTPKQYRKLLVNLTEVVESKMCAREWESITYEHLPSVAAARYARAFGKRDGERYTAFLESLKKDPSKKINVGALYPHDLYRTAMQGGQDEYATQAWARLPNFIKDGLKILPLVDTSGSMQTTASGSITCMQVAVSLGLYLAERNTGPFQNHAINFNTNSRWLTANPKQSLRQRLMSIQTNDWGGSTNLQSAFDLILNTAVTHRVPAEDMPTHLLILSDMEFNAACRMDNSGSYYNRMSAHASENFNVIDAKYARAGYKRPQIIFWNLNARAGNSPVNLLENGTALISGFSPAILKSALSLETVTPLDVMLDTVLVDRYDVLKDV